MSDRLNRIIHQLVHGKDATEIKQAYKEWVSTYDSDLAGFGYVAPQIGAAMFHTALNNPAGLIFDAGCGTGLVAQALHTHGYHNFHGADFSPDMLAQAEETGLYQQLDELDFRQPLPMADEHYDGCICIGVYSTFIGDLFLSELIRVAKTHGIICLSCRPQYFDSDLLLQAQNHAEANRVTIQSITRQPYIEGQNAEAAYIVLQKV